MSADHEIIAALSAVWRIPPPWPKNIFASPALKALSELYSERYGCGNTVLALHHALLSLGRPYRHPTPSRIPVPDLEAVASLLAQTYERKTTLRRYLCPLDLAEGLPALAFGNARIDRFEPKELEQLFDGPRLTRHHPNVPLESVRLAQFHWLVVEEEVAVDLTRTSLVSSIAWGRDIGSIDPHPGRMPAAVEKVLSFLLTAPWEDWSMMNDLDWRGFRAPWIYTVDEDLFAAPRRPPSPDSLTLEPWFIPDERGEDTELERPTVLHIDPSAAEALQKIFTPAAWSKWEFAQSSALFKTPVVHFLVRAFFAEDIDEFLAHLTTIEAAFGMESDYRPKLRPLPDPYPRLKATTRVAKRLGAAVGTPQAEQDYKDLFDLRSAYLHGRAGMLPISGRQRILARKLARRATVELTALAAQLTGSREDCLSSLLDTAMRQTP